MKNFFPDIPKDYPEVWPTGKGEMVTEIDNQIRKERFDELMTKERRLKRERVI